MDDHPASPADPKTQTERAVKAQTKLADSASHLKDSAQLQLDSAERRTVLAADRTVYAAERTYAAWMRTGLAALASGVGARSLLVDAAPLWLIRTTGSALVVFSAFCFIAAVAAVYEIMEWRYAVSSDPASGAAFLGSQGDPWDAQKDMLADMSGAVIALVLYAFRK